VFQYDVNEHSLLVEQIKQIKVRYFVIVLYQFPRLF